MAGRRGDPDWKWHEMIDKMLKEGFKYGNDGLRNYDTIYACDDPDLYNE